MPDVSVGQLVLAGLAIVYAGFIRGAIGFGGNLVLIPVLVWFLEPRLAVALPVIPGLAATPVVLYKLGVRRADLQRIWPLLLALGVGTAGGAYLLLALSASTIATIVGLLAMLFVALTALKVQLHVPPASERYVTPLAGLLCGLVAGASNVHGPPMAIYLHSLRLDKRAFVVTFTLVFLVTGLAQLASYAALGLYSPPLLLASLLACLPTIIGTRLGVQAQQHLHGHWFNRLVLGVIFVSGLTLVLR
jgi:uncharacterized membrane protein YfcA